MEKSIKPSLKDSELLYRRPFETQTYEISGRSGINGGIMPLEESWGGQNTRAFIIVNAGRVAILQNNRKLRNCVCARPYRSWDSRASIFESSLFAVTFPVLGAPKTGNCSQFFDNEILLIHDPSWFSPASKNRKD